MRHIVLTFALVLAGALAGVAFAKSHAEPDRTTWNTKDRLRVLELEVKLLQAREKALSAYVLANDERAAGIEKLVARCRREGFTGAAISSTSRISLLNGIEALAKSMREGLPAATADEEALRTALMDLQSASEKRKGGDEK